MYFAPSSLPPCVMECESTSCCCTKIWWRILVETFCALWGSGSEKRLPKYCGMIPEKPFFSHFFGLAIHGRCKALDIFWPFSTSPQHCSSGFESCRAVSPSKGRRTQLFMKCNSKLSRMFPLGTKWRTRPNALVNGQVLQPLLDLSA